MFRFTIRDVLWSTVVVGLVVGWCAERRGLQHEKGRLRGEIDRLKAGPEWIAADRLSDSLAGQWRRSQLREQELGMKESPPPEFLRSYFRGDDSTTFNRP